VLTAISAAATLAAEALQQIEQDLLRITSLIGRKAAAYVTLQKMAWQAICRAE
jgi:hypothetical protein